MSDLEEIENDIISITNKLIKLGRINNRQSQLIDKCLEVIDCTSDSVWGKCNCRSCKLLNSDEIKAHLKQVRGK